MSARTAPVSCAHTTLPAAGVELPGRRLAAATPGAAGVLLPWPVSVYHVDRPPATAV